MRIKSVCSLLLFVSSLIVSPIITAQVESNPPFPRTAILQWGGGTADWWGRFDMVMLSHRDRAQVAIAKPQHPNTLFLMTSDWLAGNDQMDYAGMASLPSVWRVKDAAGADYAYAGGYMANLSDVCPTHNGERYNQWLARKLFEMNDWSAFDGVNSDGTWSFPYNTTSRGIDLDNNGLNDYTEPGKGSNWVKQKWQGGHNTLLSNLRGRFQTRWGNSNHKLISFWSVSDTMGASLANGAGWENAPDHEPSILDWIPMIQKWESTGPSPRINYVAASVRYDAANAPARKKDYFRFMRWMLGVTLMTDSYFMMTDEGGKHYYNFYYDEFDAQLGYPTGTAQKLPNGCWVRFYDTGVVIVNPTNSTRSVSDGDLAGRNGYDGPYYRFKGNQDTLWNTGEEFTSVNLISTPASWSGNSQNVGDAIILLNSPRVVVADIIVDNAPAATTPGNAEAVLTAFYPDIEAGYTRQNPTWNIGPYSDGYYGGLTSGTWTFSDITPAGTGSNTALFSPTINVPGLYEIYEWHGWVGSSSSLRSEGTNVPHIITSEDGTDTLAVNQQINAGRWNLLGTRTFRPGGNASVKITNKANGWVIADAIRFVYIGPDTTAAEMWGTIRGKTFFDRDADGNLDIGEPGMSGWTIRLDGPESRSVQTGFDGSYEFTDLPLGSYTITQDPQLNWTRTLPPPGATKIITIMSDSVILGCDFGEYTATAVEVRSMGGWNVVSLPVSMDSVKKTSLFPSASSDAYRYISGYVSAPFLENGNGYWIKFPEEQSLWISGEPLLSTTTTVTKGWNLIGSLTAPISVNLLRTEPGDIITPPIYAYRDGNFPSDSLHPGQGYWVLANQPGVVIFGEPGAMPKQSVRWPEISQANSISFSADPASEHTLYFSAVTISPPADRYSLPPIPPPGAFDVRFLTGTAPLEGQRAAFHDQSIAKVEEFPIRIQSEKSSLQMHWSINDDRYRYEMVGNNGSVTVLNGKQGRISYYDDVLEANGVSTITLRMIPESSTPVPHTFELGQNFPNPFNNSTTVSFSIPSAGWVKMGVYDVLGELVATLSDGPREAGHHEIRIETGNWSSGVYIYKLLVVPPSGAPYSQVKLMTLLK